MEKHAMEQYELLKSKSEEIIDQKDIFGTSQNFGLLKFIFCLNKI